MTNQLELLVADENGQLAINFDALELITSQEFVEEVKSIIEMYSHKEYKLQVSYSTGDCKVFIGNFAHMTIIQFFSGINEFDRKFITYDEVEMFVKLGGEINV